MYDSRRWVIVAIGKNTYNDTHCVMGEDARVFAEQMHFGSFSIQNLDVSDLTFETALAIMSYHSHQDVFIMLMHDVEDVVFHQARQTCLDALAQQKIRGQFAIGKFCIGKVQVLGTDEKSFVPAVKPASCTNWDPRRDFQMPNGQIIKGIQLASDAA